MSKLILQTPGPIDKKNKDTERVSGYLASGLNENNDEPDDSVLLDRCLSLCYQYGVSDSKFSVELRGELSRLFKKSPREQTPFKSPQSSAQGLGKSEQLIDNLVASGPNL